MTDGAQIGDIEESADAENHQLEERPAKSEKTEQLAQGEEYENSTDGDEDYDYEKYEIGEEDTLVDTMKHNPQFTPFNMEDEEENDGHLDDDGYFVFKNKKDQIKDNWLDALEWQNAGFRSNNSTQNNNNNNNNRQEDSKEKASDNEEISKSSADEGPEYSAEELLHEIKPFLLGDMCVADCIRKYGIKTSVDYNMEKMLKLSDISDKLLGCGHFSIFEYTLKTINSILANSRSRIGKNLKDIDENDDIPAENLEFLQTKWYYKIKEEDDVIHGPFSSEQMEEMVHNCAFEGGKDQVFVSKTNTPESLFYDSKRIDFSVYS